MTSVKNRMGEAMINAGTALTNQGEKLATNNSNVTQSILNINLAAPKEVGMRYRHTTQEIRFK
jgi:hypothetical protein